MIPLLLALSLGSAQIDEEHPCRKFDGDKPTPCELNLAEHAYELQLALEGCALILQQEQLKNEKLKELILTKPAPPPEKSEWSLLGMPGWVTPTIAGVLLGGGFALGLAL